MKILKDVMKEIDKRNKTVRSADKSPGGWEGVKEYMSDLADDSKNEKQIRAAENRALS